MGFKGALRSFLRDLSESDCGVGRNLTALWDYQEKCV